MVESASTPRVLLIDEDRAALERLTDLIRHFGCITAVSADTALATLATTPFEVVISRHLELVETVHAQSPNVRFILVGTRLNTTGLVEAGRRGVHAYVDESIEGNPLATAVERALLHDDVVELSRFATAKIARPFAVGTIIGTSARLTDVLAAVDRVAHSLAPVLLVGETGTGKDLLATRIHARSPRRHRPFVVVNSGAIPRELLDSELFGHLSGAFTGATRARRGLIAEAEGGTLFLDEIGDLPLELQGRLLRVLEANTIRPVGGDHERPIDVRFVAATQRDLTDAVRSGTFRQDLYFRLNVLSIQVPALRDRWEDLPMLISYFLNDARARNPRSPVEMITEQAAAYLNDAAWPGNVRELKAFIERLVVFGKVARVEIADVLMLQPRHLDQSPVVGGETFHSLREMTMRYVESVLIHTEGDKARAASILGIDISTLYRWQRKTKTDPKN